MVYDYFTVLLKILLSLWVAIISNCIHNQHYDVNNNDDDNNNNNNNNQHTSRNNIYICVRQQKEEQVQFHLELLEQMVTLVLSLLLKFKTTWPAKQNQISCLLQNTSLSLLSLFSLSFSYTRKMYIIIECQPFYRTVSPCLFSSSFSY